MCLSSKISGVIFLSTDNTQFAFIKGSERYILQERDLDSFVCSNEGYELRLNQDNNIIEIF